MTLVGLSSSVTSSMKRLAELVDERDALQAQIGKQFCVTVGV
jgi:hypothetical protein